MWSKIVDVVTSKPFLTGGKIILGLGTVAIGVLEMANQRAEMNSTIEEQVAKITGDMIQKQVEEALKADTGIDA